MVDEPPPGFVNHLRFAPTWRRGFTTSEYDDDPDCYAVFFRDPDGVKLEVLHVRR